MIYTVLKLSCLNYKAGLKQGNCVYVKLLSVHSCGQPQHSHHRYHFSHTCLYAQAAGADRHPNNYSSCPDDYTIQPPKEWFKVENCLYLSEGKSVYLIPMNNTKADELLVTIPALIHRVRVRRQSLLFHVEVQLGFYDGFMEMRIL